MAIARVQNPDIVASQASATTITNTFVSDVTAGNLLVAFACGATGGGAHTYSSTGSPPWSKTAQFSDTGGSTLDLSIAYCLNAPAGPTTITVTYAASASFRGLVIAEYAGAAISAALDKNTTGLTTGNTATPTDSSMTTRANGELVVSALIFRNATSPASPGAGFTEIAIDQATEVGIDFGAEDQIQAAAGAIAPSWVLTAGTAPSAIMSATFLALEAEAPIPGPVLFWPGDGPLAASRLLWAPGDTTPAAAAPERAPIFPSQYGGYY